MHPKLIKANIALFNGARSEARRLLDEYRAEAADAKPTPMVLWIDAQAQDTHDERIERLRGLIETTGENDPYAQQARAFIEDERSLGDEAAPSAQGSRSGGIAGVPFGKAALFAAAGAAVAFIVFSVLNPGTGATPLPQATQSSGVATAADATLGAAASTPLDLPDRSVTVANPDNFTAQYTQGVLQITAYEDQSERAANIRDLVVLNPTTGARFYALKLLFECRAELCQDPPEASLTLELENGSQIPAMPDVGVHGETLLQPRARGRSTNGWVVFEIAADSVPARLIITPATSAISETPQPLFIDLPAL